MTKTIVKEKTHENENKFKDESVFGYDYVPENELKFRDEQLKQMINHSRSFSKGFIPNSFSLIGERATGKTITAKFYVKQLENHYDNVISIHINCKKHYSEDMIFDRIYREIFKKEVDCEHENTISKIFDYILNNNKILVVILDDYDRIKNNNCLNLVFSILLDARNTLLVAIRDINTVVKFTGHTDSRFHPVWVEFENYNIEEYYNILKERSELGFYENVISDDCIKEIAEKYYGEKSLNDGISSLYFKGI